VIVERSIVEENELNISTVHNAVQLGAQLLSVSRFTVIAVGVVHETIHAFICKSFIEAQFAVNQIHHFNAVALHNEVVSVATLGSKWSAI
jgi:hypothetical protein